MNLDFLGTLQRTGMCGELRAENAGQDVVLMGWVNRRRDHGGLIFLDLRDRSGIAQIVLDKELTPDGHLKGEQVRPEYVVAAVGKVRLRAQDAINPKMPTGEIEIEATQLLSLIHIYRDPRRRRAAIRYPDCEDILHRNADQSESRGAGRLSFHARKRIRT